MRKVWWVAFCGTGLALSLALAAPGTVTTKNEQTFEGDIKEGTDQVTVIRKGIETTIPRADISSIRYVSNTEDAIKSDLAKLKPDDVNGRLILARRAFDARQYVLARAIANEALAIDPNSAASVQMLETIRRQVLLEARTAAVEPRPVEPPATLPAKETPVPSNAGTVPGEQIPRIYLDDQDINAIRQAELQPGVDNGIRIKFLNNVQRRYAQLMQKDTAQFLRESPFSQAQEILQGGDAAMRRDVIISDDPATIKQFRSFQRQIINGCGASNCHGTTAGGQFFLYNSPENEAAMYTNFYLLNKYSRQIEGGSTGIFGTAGTNLHMIDRVRPERSLLLAYGLPPNLSDNPHPAIKGFRAPFATQNDRQYRFIQDWIANGMRRVEPSYDVKYISPLRGHATTAPTSRPAGKQPAPPADAKAVPAAVVPTPAATPPAK